MILFDHPSVAPGEEVKVTARSSFLKLVALDYPFDLKKAQQDVFILKNVKVHRVDDVSDTLEWSVTIQNISSTASPFNLDGLAAQEVRRHPETGDIGQRLQRDGSWR